MTITIQIQDNGSVTATQGGNDTGNVALTPGPGNTNDGGAPRQSLAGSDNSAGSGGDTTDIGGPPQWLSEAIAREGAGSGAGGDTSSAFSDTGTADGQDGGGGPSF